MPGNFVFKPIEGHFKDDNLDPYLKFTLGTHKAKSSVTTDKGCNPHWNETITLNRTHEEFCEIHVKDKANTFGKEIGVVKIPLADIEKHGKVHRWYDIGETGKPHGQILMEIDFDPHSTGGESGQSHPMSKEKVGSSHLSHGKEGVSGASNVNKPSHLTHGKGETSGVSNVNKEKFVPSNLPQGKEEISDMSNVNKEKFGVSNLPQGGEGISGMSNVNKEKFVSSNLPQGGEGTSGMSNLNKEKQHVPSKFAQGKEGTSNISNVNKEKLSPSDFAQGKDIISGQSNMMNKETVGTSNLPQGGEGISGMSNLNKEKQSKFPQGKEGTSDLNKPFNIEDFTEGKEKNKFTGL